jgi:hypothetical protein
MTAVRCLPNGGRWGILDASLRNLADALSLPNGSCGAWMQTQLGLASIGCRY